MSEKESGSKDPESDAFSKVQECGYESNDDSSDAEKNSVHTSDDEDEVDASDDKSSVEKVREYLAAKLGIGVDKLIKTEDDNQRHPAVLTTVDFAGIVDYIKTGKANNIITMAGAGISTSAGIPDFRTPGTGLYDNLQKFELPNPTAVFDIGFFRENPKPFFTLAKELYPGRFQPTTSHYFIKLLEKKSLLLRHFTQNIDTLEREAGISDEKIVEAHGAFHKGHCIRCWKDFSQEWIKEIIFKDEVPTCDCGGFVKPDIVFFGENLPERFFNCLRTDFRKCDLLIILGTSLVVQPFASLIDRVGEDCPRLLINMEKAGVASRLDQIVSGSGLQVDSPGNYRDVCWLGDCDQACMELAEGLGWGEELKEMLKQKEE
jgi:NAD-dependent deacetylase sirtuin 2